MVSEYSGSNRDLRRALLECADDPDRLTLILADESVTDLDVRQAILGRLPAPVSAHVMERSRFGARQSVLGAIARSPSTTARLALQALPGLTWRDLADVAVSAELPAAVRQKAEALLLEGLNAMRLGDLITLSRVGPRRVAARLLLWADPKVREAALLNPRLRDLDLCAVLETPQAPRGIASEALRVHRWAGSYEVRRGIVFSLATPHAVSLPLVVTLNLRDLKDLAASDDVPPLIGAVARRLLG